MRQIFQGWLSNTTVETCTITRKDQIVGPTWEQMVRVCNSYRLESYNLYPGKHFWGIEII